MPPRTSSGGRIYKPDLNSWLRSSTLLLAAALLAWPVPTHGFAGLGYGNCTAFETVGTQPYPNSGNGALFLPPYVCDSGKELKTAPVALDRKYFTVMLWVKGEEGFPGRTEGDCVIQHTDFLDHGDSTLGSSSDGAAQHFRMSFNCKGNMYVAFTPESGAGPNTNSYSAQLDDASLDDVYSWRHFAFTYNNGDGAMTLYQNLIPSPPSGEEQEHSNGGYNRMNGYTGGGTDGSPFRLYADTGNNLVVDEFRVFWSELSEDEIRAQWTSAPMCCGGLVVSYTFDDCTGGTSNGGQCNDDFSPALPSESCGASCVTTLGVAECPVSRDADNDKKCPSKAKCEGYTAVKMDKQGVSGLMEACQDFGGPALIFNERDNEEAFRVCRDFAGERAEQSQCLIGLVQGKKSREPDEGWEWYDRSKCSYRAWVDGEPNDYGSSGEDMAVLNLIDRDGNDHAERWVDVDGAMYALCGCNANSECEGDDWHEDHDGGGTKVVIIIIVAVVAFLLLVAIGVCVFCKVCKKAAHPAEGLPTSLPMATVVEAKPIDTGASQQNQTFSGSL